MATYSSILAWRIHGVAKKLDMTERLNNNNDSSGSVDSWGCGRGFAVWNISVQGAGPCRVQEVCAHDL